MDEIVELLACRDEQRLSWKLDSLLGRFGVSRWVYALNLPVHGGSREQYSTGAYPDAWVDRYLEEGYLSVDPIVRHCAGSVLPLLWDDAARACERLETARARRAQQMFREAGELGMGAGLSVPLHGPGQSWGLISFAAEARVMPDLRANSAQLHTIAMYAHEAGRRFAGNGGDAVQPELTRRERECLQWAAEGKTSWEIGRLLRISERTVIFHLNNASQRLGVCSRQAAVARGVSLGFVTVR